MTMREFAAWLLSYDDIAVIGHISPDGDAVGSSLAVARALLLLGKRAAVVLADGVPQKYRFLPGADEVCGVDALPFSPQCALAVDTSEPRRLGDALFIFENSPHKGCLDHHETNAGFGDACFIDGARASTGELALDLIQALGAPIDVEIASNLYIAIAADTGNFNYRNTDARAFAAAAICVRHGADVGELSRRAFRTRSLARTRLLGDALGRIQVTPDGKIAYTRVDSAMLARAGATLEDASGISNYLNEIDGALVGVYFEQQADNTKISWRAACDLNVADVAAQFGGGGHDAAAGANLALPMDAAIQAVLEKTADALRAFEARV
ncbi:MAG: DHH family phosphoesterase [Christensenellales bacterium]|jgi:phosphoesterase RecJ-like protein